MKKGDFIGEQLGDSVILNNDFSATSLYLKIDFMIRTQIFGLVPTIIKPK